MSHEDVLRDIAGKLPVRPNARKRRIWIACFVVGAASLAYLFATNPLRAWGAWAINTIYFLGVAQGAIALSASYRLSNGRWGGPVMRIAESFTAYLPVGIATLLVLLVGGIGTYLPWVQGVEPRLKPFLNVPFLYVRTLGGALLFWWLSAKLVRVTLRSDLQALKPHVAPELKAEYERMSANWKGDEAEAKWRRHELAHLSPQLALTFVIFFSVLGWDFIMELTPNWVSGLFGWWIYAGAFIAGIAMTAFMAVQLRAEVPARGVHLDQHVLGHRQDPVRLVHLLGLPVLVAVPDHLVREHSRRAGGCSSVSRSRGARCRSRYSRWCSPFPSSECSTNPRRRSPCCS